MGGTVHELEAKLRVFSAKSKQLLTIDGKRLPDPTPLLKLRLRTGHHRVELANPELGLRKTIRVRIRAGATTWKVVHLR